MSATLALAANDTIAAIATATGAGGVGIVRVSGPAAVEIAEAIVGKSLPDRRVVYGVARDLHGTRLDDVVAFTFRAPKSFTGEDIAELQGHGGAFNLSRLLGATLARGARAAEAGEFTRRAFANGRLDLARAEALRQVIGATSERAWRVAQTQLAGAMGQRVEALRGRALGPLVEIEAACDFPDDDLAVRDATWLVPELATTAAAAHALASTYRAGRLLERGLEVALVGPVNVGKSSLLNALLGEARAIVDAEPGTTRDYIEGRCIWNGVPITLVDTAGLRLSADAIEARGITLGQQRTERADVVLVMSDADAAPDLASYGARAIWVRSKCDEDLPMPACDADTVAGAALRTSAKTGAGLDALRMAILAHASSDELQGGDLLITSERQQALLTAAGDHLHAAAVGLTSGLPMEMIALDVRQAVGELAEVSGTEVGEAVLDQLFARFCIGK